MYKINYSVERKGNCLHSEPEGTKMKHCTGTHRDSATTLCEGLWTLSTSANSISPLPPGSLTCFPGISPLEMELKFMWCSPWLHHHLGSVCILLTFPLWSTGTTHAHAQSLNSYPGRISYASKCRTWNCCPFPSFLIGYCQFSRSITGLQILWTIVSAIGNIKKYFQDWSNTQIWKAWKFIFFQVADGKYGTQTTVLCLCLLGRDYSLTSTHGDSLIPW